jgi:hypothetical protein
VPKKLSIAFQRTFDFADYLHTKPTPSSFVPLERGLRVLVAEDNQVGTVRDLIGNTGSSV